MRRRTGLLLCALLGSGGALSGDRAQDDPPVFRVETRLVEVDVHVHGRDGSFVTDLTKEDFEILEDGVPHDVGLLTMVNVPVGPRGRPGAIGPEETGAVAGPAGWPGVNLEDMGRLYVMILDSGRGLFPSSLPEDVRARTLRAARLFVEEFLGPTDLMAVLHVGQPPGAGQGLTHDKDLLLAAIERYRPRMSSGLASFRTIKEAAVHLNAVTGRRKSILFFGAGTGALWASSASAEGAAAQRELWHVLNDALQTAVQNNVRVHTIDPTGFAMFVGGDLTGESPPPSIDMGPGPSDAHASLRMIAADTGGRAIVNTSNFAGNFERIVRDDSAYYVLGYYSSAPRDGAVHQITVRVKRPGLSVQQGRRSYRAPLADVPGRAVPLPRGLAGPVRAALQDGVVRTPGLRVDASASVFRAEAFNGSVLVEGRVGGRGLSVVPGDRIEVAYAAVDSQGRVRAAARQAFTMQPGAATQARVAEHGLRLFARLTVPAGRYEIRVAAYQPGGATGLANTVVEVPHFADASLSVSDLTIASSRPELAMTLVEDDQLRRELGARPVRERRFAPGETLVIYGEIYDSHWLLATELAVTSTITREDGAVVVRDRQTLRADGGVFRYRGNAPLGALGPGAYVLTVEAHTTAGVPAAASRQLPFEVGYGE